MELFLRFLNLRPVIPIFVKNLTGIADELRGAFKLGPV
jgi:hypothetical protein